MPERPRQLREPQDGDVPAPASTSARKRLETPAAVGQGVEGPGPRVPAARGRARPRAVRRGSRGNPTAAAMRCTILPLACPCPGSMLRALEETTLGGRRPFSPRHPPPRPLRDPPDRYRHWKLAVDGADRAARSWTSTRRSGLRPGYELKLNSYDLGVDIELADAIQRLRFEHPEVRVLLVTSGKDRIFCAGANIFMLGTSTHAFKVNFCKFTNETRLVPRGRLARTPGCAASAAVNGTARAAATSWPLACDEILLVDDGNSAGEPARGAAARRAARHGRPHAHRGQAQGPPRPRRRVQQRSPRASRASARRSGASSTRRSRPRASPRASRTRLKAVAAAQATRWAHRKGPGVALDAARRRRTAPTAPTYRHVDLRGRRGGRARPRLTITAPPGPVPATAAEARAAGMRLVDPARLPRARRRAARPALQPPRDRPRARSRRRATRAVVRATDALLARRRTTGSSPRSAQLRPPHAQAPRPHGEEPLRAGRRPARASSARSSSWRSPPTASTCWTTRTAPPALAHHAR